MGTGDPSPLASQGPLPLVEGQKMKKPPPVRRGMNEAMEDRGSFFMALVSAYALHLARPFPALALAAGYLFVEGEDGCVAPRFAFLNGAGGHGVDVGQPQQFGARQAVAGGLDAAFLTYRRAVLAKDGAVADAAELTVDPALATVPGDGGEQFAPGASAFQSGSEPAPGVRLGVALGNLGSHAHVALHGAGEQLPRPLLPAPGFGGVEGEGKRHEIGHAHGGLGSGAEVAVRLGQAVFDQRRFPALGEPELLLGGGGVKQTVRADRQPHGAEIEGQRSVLHTDILAQIMFLT
ncbi:hypothetical protein DR_0003 [Deinococcus radiodurans R1 = ATCC 13939 = DSM 20539]|nr:hypothetical protein DR_0003 [Deinococcus radiodurans R1 = ATCC 13939 = DSM 20539]